MKYWMSILAFGLHVSASAQEYRDTKSWLNDMVNSEFMLPDDLRGYESIYENFIPSISLQETHRPEFKVEPFQFRFSEKLICTSKWDKDYFQFNNMKSLWKPTKKLLMEGENFTKNTMFCPKNLIGTNLKIEYKQTNRISLNLHGYYMANDYKNPNLSLSTLYRFEIGGNLSYNITQNLKIKPFPFKAYAYGTKRTGK